MSEKKFFDPFRILRRSWYASLKNKSVGAPMLNASTECIDLIGDDFTRYP